VSKPLLISIDISLKKSLTAIVSRNMLTPVKSLGSKLKELREAKGWSLRKAAQNLSGISAAHLSDIERGHRFPSKNLLTKLADTFEIEPEELEKYDIRPTMKEIKRRAHVDPAFSLKLQGVAQDRTPANIPAAERSFTHSTNLAQKLNSAYSVEIIVRLIASGLIELHHQHTKFNEPLSADYPKKLQRGFDRLVALCLLNGRQPPQSVPDLLALCEKPFKDWALPQLPEDVNPQETLLRHHLPSFFCEDYARADRDIEAALTEERFMQRVFFECANLPAEVYTALRGVLVSRPVLTEQEFMTYYTRPPLVSVAEVIKEAYEEAPGYLLYKGCFRCCPECGNLLLHSSDGGWLCRDESCEAERLREDKIVRTLCPTNSEKVYELKRALRRYIAAPGRVELRLKERLLQAASKTRGFAVELYPNMDAYDLRLTFPNREVWAVDVKDWASPYRLAEAVKPFRTFPTWDQAFFVFPDRYKSKHRNYLEAFRSRCVYLNERIQAVFESDLVTAARQKLRGVK
jgi:transcriptional regulator with XRE-family HTH domain